MSTTPQESQWDELPKSFLSDPDQIYLNTASWGVISRCTYDAMVAAIRERELNPTANRASLQAGVRESRRMLAEFMNASPNDLAFMTNVTVAMNTIVNGLQWQEGDEILLSDQEYGAIENCVHNATQRWGAVLRKVKIPVPPQCPEDVIKAFEAGFTDRTRMVLCSHVTTGSGIIMPIKALAELAHARGALIAIDGAHAPGMIPLDLDDYGCDFYGGNCHKWLCAPKGVGFLHVAPAVQELMSHIVVSWGYSRSGATKDDDGRLTINGEPYMWGIEMWGTISLPERVATGAAVQFQTDIGVDKIAARGRQLAGYLRDRMAAHDWTTLISPTNPEMSGSISRFTMTGLGDTPLEQTLLNRYRITLRAGGKDSHHSMRVSTHIYNTFAEIDTLVDALEELRHEAS